MDFLDQLDELNRPTINKKPWMADVELLLGTIQMLESIEQEILKEGRVGCDLETTGLDCRAFPTASGKLETVDKIVGVCLAPTKTRAYYLPIRHKDDGAQWNIPPRLVMAMIKRLRHAGVVFVFHNYKFDCKFLRYEPSGDTGDWDEVVSWHDTLILGYLRNPRERQNGLKFLSKTLLNREMIEFDDLFLQEKGKKRKYDFAALDPSWEPCVWYAASDALNTLCLLDLLLPIIIEKDSHGRSQKTIYTIEKLCMVATLWMEQCRIYIDRVKLVELIQLGQAEWWECLKQVYAEVGEALGRDVRPGWVHVMDTTFNPKVLTPDYMEARELARKDAPNDTRASLKKSVPSLTDPKVRETVEFPPTYDVTIPAEFGLMLRELGVQGLQATEKSGQVKTSKEVLEEVIENAGDQFPWMKKVRRFREVTKSLSTVLFNLYRDTALERCPDGAVWANFNGTKVDTGRFSTPTPSEVEFHGQVDWNVQSTKAYYYDPKDPPPECVYRQREVVAARPGYIMFAIDYSGVELRIVTNLSGEPKWLAEFFHCSTCDHTFERGTLPPPFCPQCGSDKIGDLHTLTAISLYNVNPATEDPKAFKLKRQVGKIVNFLLCYGGTGTAVMRSTGCDKEEGWRIKNQFDKAYKGLLKWWNEQHKIARVQEYVTTAYGRKYPVPDIKHEFAKFRSKAERNAVNGPVQGSSADIMKLAMGLLYREFKKRGWINRGPGLPDLVLMVITIHDELVFEFHESVVGEALPIVEDIMCKKTVQNLNWIVPLKVDMEFGADWTGEYNLTELAWNKSKEKWTPELVRMLPTFYANYLAVGGAPIDVDAPPVESSGLHPALEPPKAAAAAGAPKPTQASAGNGKPLVEPLRDGEAYVYQISSRSLTPDVARKLAQVIVAVEGRGVDVIKVRDEYGNDLIGTELKGAWQEFQSKVNEVGL